MFLLKRQKTAAYYKTRPNEIDSKLLQVIPDAPRTASSAFPASWDWNLLTDLPGEGKKSESISRTTPVEETKVIEEVTTNNNEEPEITHEQQEEAVEKEDEPPAQEEEEIEKTDMEEVTAEPEVDHEVNGDDNLEENAPQENGEAVEAEEAESHEKEAESHENENTEVLEIEFEETEEPENKEDEAALSYKSDENENVEEREEPKSDTPESQKIGVIEGVVNGEDEVETLNNDENSEEPNRSFNSDDEDAEISELVETGNMEQLASLVLNGEGNKLVGQHSDNPEIQAFLENVPIYMVHVIV